MATVLFLHGWNSKTGGVKPTYLAEHGHSVLNPSLPDESFAESVRIAQAEFDRHQPSVVVGSSRGGAVAMNIDAPTARLVLLCPAWSRWGAAKTVKPGTLVLHSEADDVIPIAHSRELVAASGLPTSASSSWAPTTASPTPNRWPRCWRRSSNRFENGKPPRF